jgi:hypothetical protein
MNEIKAYECNFCNKYYKKTKKTVEKHEAICFSNPVRKACQTCSNLGLKNKDNFLVNYCHDFETFMKIFVCECQRWEPKNDFEEQSKQELQ